MANGVGFNVVLPAEGENHRGRVNMKMVATNNLFFTGSSSLLEFGGEMHHLSKQGELYYHLIDLALIKGFSKAQLCDMGDKLIAMADHALDMRQTEAAERISEILVNAPLPREYRQIGRYYQAMCVMRRGDYIASRAILEQLAESPITPFKYRTRALNSLGANYFYVGDLNEYSRFNLEAACASSSRYGYDLFTSIMSLWAVAMIKSIEGDHRGALADFESLFPFVRMLAMERPFYLYSYRNSLALELAEAGRIEEAQNNCRIILSSSLAHLNPEWSETAEEVAQKARRASHSIVAISSAPSESAAHFDAADNPDEASKASGSDRLPPELCNLAIAQKLYLLKKTGWAWGLDKEMLDRMMKSTGVADIDSQCCGHTHHQDPSDRPHEPQQIDIESESDLEFLIRLWSNEEIDPALFAATYMALDACKDRFRCDQIVDRIARLAFLESPECSQLQKEWLSKVENLVDLQSLDDLEEKVRLWFNNEGMQAEIAAVILSWHMCKDDALRSETSRRLVRFAFLASPDSEDMSEDEWREKVKAMVKPIADLPS